MGNYISLSWVIREEEEFKVYFGYIWVINICVFSDLDLLSLNDALLKVYISLDLKSKDNIQKLSF